MSTEKEVPNSSTPEIGVKKKRVDLDTILVDELGQFGWFQLQTLLWGLVVAIFASFGANEYVFTTARIPTRCLIEECDLETPVFSQPWLSIAIPTTASGSLEQCSRFVSANSSGLQDQCPPSWFNQNVLKSCERRVYENTDTVVYDYDLGCDDWRRSFIGSIRTFGVLLAMPITGYISDRWGRRTALVLNAFNTGWLGCLRYFADTYIGFTISECVESMLGAAGFTSIYILIMEVVGPKYRVAAGACLNTFFSVGQVLLGLIAWGVPNWRYLTLALYAPMLLTFVLYWILSESVRWYMSKGRFDEAEQVLRKIAKVNKRHLNEQSLESLRETVEEEKKKQAKLREEMKNEPLLIVQVFRHKRILARCCFSPVWWITTTFVYYGLAINAVNLSGNRYVNYIAVSAAQIPGYWTAVLLLPIVGRKPVLIVAFWICAACQIAYVFIPEGQYAVSLVVYLIGTFAIASVMTSIYVYTAELYPTRYRHNLFAFSSMMGRIGAILAPLTPALGVSVWTDLPFVLFASFALLSGALVFLTPETLGTTLPDTMEQASNLGKRPKPGTHINTS